MKDLWSRVKRLRKNEYLQTITLLVIVIIGITGFQLVLRAIFKTDYPLAVVEGDSMIPKLREGDIVVIQGVSNGCQISLGDIIVFYERKTIDTIQTKQVYWFFTAPVLIVHRVIDKFQKGNLWYFSTKGDNTQGQHWFEKEIPETLVVGKVMFQIPLLGHISLFMQDWGIPTIICLMVALIAIEYLFSEKEMAENQKKLRLYKGPPLNWLRFAGWVKRYSNAEG